VGPKDRLAARRSIGITPTFPSTAFGYSVARLLAGRAHEALEQLTRWTFGDAPFSDLRRWSRIERPTRFNDLAVALVEPPQGSRVEFCLAFGLGLFDGGFGRQQHRFQFLGPRLLMLFF
jgi:hypothetical protein